jgi:hypothetical protein
MKAKQIKNLKNLKVKFIYRVIVTEYGIDYDLSDTLILTLEDNSIIQILVDSEIKIYKLSSEEDILILGEYDFKNSIKKLVLIKEIINNEEIANIYNYLQSTYHFGSKFMNFKNEFIFGFCFGWDEISLLDENEFNNMLLSYPEHSPF